ncbi:hypothetical protein [Bradyrhizobium cenepequi]|uniref:hypothetical protein n=1 Tax=Bradyrhizobium cenepequi TaxID=2821403 RepID=UPI001CE2F0E4|nr:hypothetical protein [Bradyrhizobium cenepequi]
MAEDGRSLTLFCINRNFDHAIDTEINLRGFELSSFLESHIMMSDDLNATNTAAPQRVRPEKGPAATAHESGWRLSVPAASWCVFRFECQPAINAG